MRKGVHLRCIILVQVVYYASILATGGVKNPWNLVLQRCWFWNFIEDSDSYMVDVTNINVFRVACYELEREITIFVMD